MANADYMNVMQAWAMVALKAQNQCRQTLATLADIKNPRQQSATFIKQNNCAVNQQINNEVSENMKKTENEKNELLTEATYETLDTPEERKRQAQIIRNWKPWRRSTGAKTPEGKANSKMNAFKHGGETAKLREARRLLNHYQQLCQGLVQEIW